MTVILFYLQVNCRAGGILLANANYLRLLFLIELISLPLSVWSVTLPPETFAEARIKYNVLLPGSVFFSCCPYGAGAAQSGDLSFVELQKNPRRMPNEPLLRFWPDDCWPLFQILSAPFHPWTPDDTRRALLVSTFRDGEYRYLRRGDVHLYAPVA